MSKHKYKKEKKSVRRSVRTAGLLLLSVVFFFSSMYGYRCFVEKVCESEIIERVVRPDTTVLMPKGAIVAEVASTKTARALGLSGRTKMKDSEAMLFIFDVPGKYGFWMKDMNFPLDIVWINNNGVIVWIERNATPESYPKAFMNQADASYVLEMNAGLSEKFGLYLGSKIKFGE
jgi:uncharacterized membrane protein (UPF0127 family)